MNNALLRTVIKSWDLWEVLSSIFFTL